MEHDPQDDMDDEHDPLVQELIHEALAPYQGLLSAELTADMARALELVLTTHPTLAPRVRGLRPRAPRAVSGEETRGDVAEAVRLPRSGTDGDGR
ncbi:MAG: hypothetical protein ABI193_17630 [Minicystis sp.]